MTKKTFGVYLNDYARASGKTARGMLIREMRADSNLIKLSSPRTVRKAVVSTYGDAGTVINIVRQFDEWRAHAA